MKNHFATIDSPGELHECENTINSVFSKLIDKQKYCKLLVNEIRIKPAIRNRRNRSRKEQKSYS